MGTTDVAGPASRARLAHRLAELLLSARPAQQQDLAAAARPEALLQEVGGREVGGRHDLRRARWHGMGAAHGACHTRGACACPQPITPTSSAAGCELGPRPVDAALWFLAAYLLRRHLEPQRQEPLRVRGPALGAVVCEEKQPSLPPQLVQRLSPNRGDGAATGTFDLLLLYAAPCS
jgi:hypothetical protein